MLACLLLAASALLKDLLDHLLGVLWVSVLCVLLELGNKGVLDRVFCLLGCRAHLSAGGAESCTGDAAEHGGWLVRKAQGEKGEQNQRLFEKKNEFGWQEKGGRGGRGIRRRRRGCGAKEFGEEEEGEEGRRKKRRRGRRREVCV